MVYLFCLFDAQRGFLDEGAGEMNEGGGRAATGPPAVRSRVVSTRTVSRSERVERGAGCLCFTLLFYLST